MSSLATHGPDQMGQGKSVREWWARPSLFHSINVARGRPSKFVVRNPNLPHLASNPFILRHALSRIRESYRPHLPYC